MAESREPATGDEVQQLKDLFGASLEARRKQLGFRTQAALARAAGVNRESVARIERGEGNPELETLIRIALAMRMSLSQLFGSMGQPEAGGRQLTVRERGLVVIGARLMLESLTGSTTGDLTGSGIASLTGSVDRDTYPEPWRRRRKPPAP